MSTVEIIVVETSNGIHSVYDTLYQKQLYILSIEYHYNITMGKITCIYLKLCIMIINRYTQLFVK